MSMISDQVKELRQAEKNSRNNMWEIAARIFKEAADTIEELSDKLHEANMERSNAFYHGGWIPCSERLPEENTDVLVCCKDGVICIANRYTNSWFEHFYSCELNVIAWMPLPEPYREDVEE